MDNILNVLSRFGPRGIIGGSGGIVFLVIAASIVLVGFYFDGKQHEIVRSDLSYMAAGAAMLVDGDAHNALRDPRQLGSEAHETALEPLVAFQNAIPAVTNFYTMIEQDGNLFVILDTAASTNLARRTTVVANAINERFIYDPKDYDGWFKALRNGKAVVGSGAMDDDYSAAIKAAAPFRDSSGKVVGFVAINIADRYFHIRHWSRASIFSLATLIGLAAAMFAGWYVKGALSETGTRRSNLFAKATIDATTGVTNRQYFILSANEELARVRRHGVPMTLMILRIDDLKRIREEYGDSIADRILEISARLLQKSLREIDVVGRIDEADFAIMLRQTNVDGAMIVAERLRKSVSEIALPTAKSGDIGFTVCVGMTPAMENDQAFDSLHSRADRALFMARDEGPGKVAIE